VAFRLHRSNRHTGNVGLVDERRTASIAGLALPLRSSTRIA
jgi:hypothetical protein